MLLSIVVPTVDRSFEFDRFMRSLLSQSKKALTELELIVVDQNQDDRIATILKDTEAAFSVVHMRAQKNGVSAAKNIGMKLAKGKFCCFLDDDCWLSANYLGQIMDILKGTSPQVGLLIKAISPDGQSLLPHAVPKDFKLSEKNIKEAFNTPQISHIYPQKEGLSIGGFNEHLGTGIFLGSAEETDFLVRMVQQKVVFNYHEQITILHNKVDYSTMTPAKSYQYGLGFGAFCRMHGWYLFFCWKLIRPLAGSMIYLGRDTHRSKSYYQTFLGRLHGFLHRSVDKH